MDRWMMGVIVGVSLTACGGNGGDDPTAGDGMNATENDDAGSDTGDAEASVSAEDDNGDDEAGDEASDSDTEGVGMPCHPEAIELVDVQLTMAEHRVMGEDVVAPFDPAQGSSACLVIADDGEIDLRIRFGPFDDHGPRSNLHVEIRDGVRSYDLATDAGATGTAEVNGTIDLTLGYDVENATTLEYGTQATAGTGTLEVTALPIDGATDLAMHAIGDIGGEDGWAFDLTIVAALP